MYGIDFGTSNTVVTAASTGGSVPLDLGEGGVLPSLLYFERGRGPSIGGRAMADYADALSRFRGRTGLHERFRLFQGLKLALKDEFFTGTRVFGALLSPEELVAVFLRELLARIEAEAPGPGRGLVLGRPVVLSRSRETDARLEGRFRAAATRAGFEEISFVPEPVAAAASLLGRIRGLVLVFDFGGGTLDIAVARLRADGIELLAGEGADLGGFLLNEDLSRARVIGHFGAGGRFRTMTGRELAMPAWITRQVSSFHALPLADIARTRAMVRGLLAEARVEDKPGLRGLLDFLDRNLSFSLFRDIDRAKIELSTDETSTLEFAVPPHVRLREAIARSEFESLALPRVAAAAALVDRALASAGVEAGEVATVVRVGGSSRIQAFIRMLEGKFPGRVEEGEVFTSIARGLLEARKRGLAA